MGGGRAGGRVCERAGGQTETDPGTGTGTGPGTATGTGTGAPYAHKIKESHYE